MLRDWWVRLESALVRVSRPRKAHCNSLMLEALVLLDDAQIIRMVYLARCPWAIGQSPANRRQDFLTSPLMLLWPVVVVSIYKIIAQRDVKTTSNKPKVDM